MAKHFVSGRLYKITDTNFVLCGCDDESHPSRVSIRLNPNDKAIDYMAFNSPEADDAMCLTVEFTCGAPTVDNGVMIYIVESYDHKNIIDIGSMNRREWDG